MGFSVCTLCQSYANNPVATAVCVTSHISHILKPTQGRWNDRWHIRAGLKNEIQNRSVKIWCLYLKLRQLCGFSCTCALDGNRNSGSVKIKNTKNQCVSAESARITWFICLFFRWGVFVCSVQSNGKMQLIVNLCTGKESRIQSPRKWEACLKEEGWMLWKEFLDLFCDWNGIWKAPPKAREDIQLFSQAEQYSLWLVDINPQSTPFKQIVWHFKIYVWVIQGCKFNPLQSALTNSTMEWKKYTNSEAGASRQLA